MNRIQKINFELYESLSTSTILTFKIGQGYWDVSTYPYGSNFKRIKDNDTGTLIQDACTEKALDIAVLLNGKTKIIIGSSAVLGNDTEEVLALAKKMGQISSNEIKRNNLRNESEISKLTLLTQPEKKVINIIYCKVQSVRSKYLKNVPNLDDVTKGLISKGYLNSKGGIMPTIKALILSLTNDERNSLFSNSLYAE